MLLREFHFQVISYNCHPWKQQQGLSPLLKYNLENLLQGIRKQLRSNKQSQVKLCSTWRGFPEAKLLGKKSSGDSWRRRTAGSASSQPFSNVYIHTLQSSPSMIYSPIFAYSLESFTVEATAEKILMLNLSKVSRVWMAL